MSETPVVETVDAVLKRHVLAVLERHGSDRTATARALGVSPKTVYNWLVKWQVPTSDRRHVSKRIPQEPRMTMLTTGQCARLCQVAPRTVTKWIDAGKLKGHLLPLSNDRRVYVDDLVSFLKERGLRVPQDLQPAVAVAFGLQAGESVPGFETVDPFALVERVRECNVTAAIIGDADGLGWAERAVKVVKGGRADARCVLVLDAGAVPYQADPAVWAACHRRPVDLAAVAAELAGDRAC